MKPNIILVKGIIYHKVSTEMEPKQGFASPMKYYNEYLEGEEEGKGQKGMMWHEKVRQKQRTMFCVLK